LQHDWLSPLAPSLQFRALMNKKTLCTAIMFAFAAVLSPLSLSGVGFPRQPRQVAVSANQKETVATFERRVKDYVKQRERIRKKVPKLSKGSTPEQIEANEEAFAQALRAARASAKPGDIFTPDVANYIRSTLKREFKESDKKEIRKIVLGADTKDVPLRVNYPYPEPKEFSEMPPTLLLKLPPLPKQVNYRYVGRNLMLVDTDNNIIIDYMLDALP
jgi:hypothetical protein